MAFSQQAPVVMDSGLDAAHRPGMTDTATTVGHIHQLKLRASFLA
jgi:hypothetical protein